MGCSLKVDSLGPRASKQQESCSWIWAVFSMRTSLALPAFWSWINPLRSPYLQRLLAWHSDLTSFPSVGFIFCLFVQFFNGLDFSSARSAATDGYNNIFIRKPYQFAFSFSPSQLLIAGTINWNVHPECFLLYGSKQEYGSHAFCLGQNHAFEGPHKTPVTSLQVPSSYVRAGYMSTSASVS